MCIYLSKLKVLYSASQFVNGNTNKCTGGSRSQVGLAWWKCFQPFIVLELCEIQYIDLYVYIIYLCCSRRRCCCCCCRDPPPPSWMPSLASSHLQATPSHRQQTVWRAMWFSKYLNIFISKIFKRLNNFGFIKNKKSFLKDVWSRLARSDSAWTKTWADCNRIVNN